MENYTVCHFIKQRQNILLVNTYGHMLLQPPGLLSQMAHYLLWECVAKFRL